MLEKYNSNHYLNTPSGDDFSDWLYENSHAEAPEPDVDKAWLTLSSKISTSEQKHRKWMPILRIAAVVTFLALSVFIIRDLYLAPEMIEMIARDGDKNIVLPDGSSVILKEGSEIHYPEAFGKSREVTFSGEAYFEIAKSEATFTVNMNGGEVTVLGTAFNLVSNQEEIAVAVDHGLVKLSGIENNETKVGVGHYAKLNKITQTLSLYDTTPSNVHSWRTGEFVFSQTPLSQVVRELEKHYNVSFKLSKKVSDCRITANFDQLTIQQICDALETILSANVSQKGSTVIIRGKGCE